MRVFVTGGTGYIGRALIAALGARGDEAVVVSRSAARAQQALGERALVVEGDPTAAGEWQARVAGCDAAVNLAGESVGGRRWNAQVRQIIKDSRVDATRLLVEAIAAAPDERRPRALLSASGVDYYPFDVDLGAAGMLDDEDEVDERTPPGEGFLARVCREWEAEAREAEALGVRVVRMRVGLVVGGAGGPLERWTRAFRAYLGGRLGGGRQWVSWIHLDDVIGATLFALDQETLSGPVNVVSPRRMRNADFAAALGAALGRPAWLPTPGFALRAALGDFADYILHGRPVVPKALLAAGYQFKRDAPF